MGLLPPSVRLPVCLLGSCSLKEVEMVCRQTVGSIINPTWAQQERKEILPQHVLLVQCPLRFLVLVLCETEILLFLKSKHFGNTEHFIFMIRQCSTVSSQTGRELILEN